MTYWLGTLLMGAGLLAFMALLDKHIKKNAWRHWLPYLEGGLWVGYLLLGSYITLGDYAFYQYILQAQMALLVIGIGWLVGKEYIPGLFVRLAIAKQGNERMTIKGVEGKIVKVKALWLEVATSQGIVVVIPYSRARISYATDAQNSDKQQTIKTFHLTVPKNTPVNEEALRRLLLTLPWVSTKVMPTVKSHTQDPNIDVWEITIPLLKGGNPKTVEQYLLNYLLNRQV